MRTTLGLDRDLLERARKVLGTETFTEAIQIALGEAVARAEARSGWERLIGADLSWEAWRSCSTSAGVTVAALFDTSVDVFCSGGGFQERLPPARLAWRVTTRIRRWAYSGQ